ncbi:MAG: hypothetical protein Ct9H90mP16_00030 [Candidatus Poseidoniales archaeon]|nr:MAG: hypothetical protein Ct9H90mP16_00030 [Candidatus Poseidoniales archaeon]
MESRNPSTTPQESATVFLYAPHNSHHGILTRHQNETMGFESRSVIRVATEMSGPATMAVVITPGPLQAQSWAQSGQPRVGQPAADSLASIVSRNQTGTAFFGRGQPLGKIENLREGGASAESHLFTDKIPTGGGPNTRIRGPFNGFSNVHGTSILKGDAWKVLAVLSLLHNRAVHFLLNGPSNTWCESWPMTERVLYPSYPFQELQFGTLFAGPKPEHLTVASSSGFIATF